MSTSNICNSGIKCKAGPGRPRDPKRAQKRRTTILSHAVRHFAKKGFAGADIDAIAADAGCSKGTIYNYFPSKGELFQQCVDHVMQGLKQAIAEVEVSNVIESFGLGIRAFLMYFNDNPHFIELLIQERAEFRDRDTPSYREYSAAHRLRKETELRSLIEQGVFREFPVERFMEIAGDLLYGTIFTNYFALRKIDLEQQAADITDLLLYGMLARPENEENPFC